MLFRSRRRPGGGLRCRHRIGVQRIGQLVCGVGGEGVDGEGVGVARALLLLLFLLLLNPSVSRDLWDHEPGRDGPKVRTRGGVARVGGDDDGGGGL